MSTFNQDHWDKDGDGKLTSGDLMAAFDTNHDGNLDASELAVFVEQLSNQLQYNNTLLTQLNELEKDQLKCHQEINSKQEIIKKMTFDAELLKVELGETKKKLNIAQETIDTLTKQSKDCRADALAFKTESERALKDANALKNLLDKANTDKAKLLQDLADIQQTFQQKVDLAEKFSSDSHAQIATLRQANEASERELLKLREGISLSEHERKSLLNHLNEVSTSLEQMAAQYHEESTRREALERQFTDLSSMHEEKHEKHLEMEFLLQEAVDQAEMHQNNLKDVQDKLEETESKNKLLEEKLHEALSQADSLEEQNQHLTKDYETISRDLNLCKKNFQTEQEKWNARLQSVKNDSSQAITEIKRQSQEFSSEAQKQLAIVGDARAKAEELLLKAQAECNASHELIDQLRQDHSNKEAQWKAYQARLEEAIEQERAKNQNQDEKSTALERRMQAERDQLQTDLRNARLESIQRGEFFVQTLTQFQTQIKAVKDQSVVEKNKVRELGGMLSAIKAKCTQQIEKSTTASNSLKTEVEAVFQGFIQRLEKTAEQHESALDVQKRVEIAHEEEKSKVLDLEEAVSRLEHKLAALENSKVESEHLAEAAIAQQRSLTERYATDKIALENKIQKLQQALNETTASARNIQATNLTMHATIGDVANKQAIARQDVESKLSQITAQLRRATEENEQQEIQNRELRDKLTQLSEELHSAFAREERANREISELKQKHGETANQHLQMLSNAGEATQQYSLQIRQLQERLQTLQQQKSELQLQNQTLRSELDQQKLGSG